MRTPSSQKCRLDLAPPVADRFITGMVPHRLRPGTSPHALRIPSHDGHPALRRTTSDGFRYGLAVSGFRLRARLGVTIPFALPGQRGYYPPLLDMAPLIRAPEGL